MAQPWFGARVQRRIMLGFSILVTRNQAGNLRGYRFRLVVFFFKHRQFINNDIETRLGLYVQGLAHHFELDAVVAFRAAGKDLSGEQRHLMRKAMALMRYPIDAALRHGFIGTEFLRFQQTYPRA